jgi:CIC family chloride channel protein
MEAPRWLRLFVRARASSLLLLAVMIGLLGGLVVATMGEAVGFLHRMFFHLQPGAFLSAQDALNPVLAVATPLLGGLAFGLASALIARRRPRREIDPVEANALHGGRMSLIGSFVVAAKTVWSSGVGASVGLEAGYTQLASGIASRIGQSLRLRRSDLRILVGCGAAAGISGAFGSPLGGAFYAFEIVVGNYSVFSLAPVTIAAVVGFLTVNALSPAHLVLVSPEERIGGHDLVISAVLGLLAAFFGIALMRGVPLCEAVFNRLKVRPLLRPAIGGVLVGGLAIASPQVMSAGHGALHVSGVLHAALPVVATVLVMKAAASIISLGSGFRGGLFFASMLMGALGGRLLATGLIALWPGIGIDPGVYAVVGMSALSASVIGGPMTMTFIALESTGDLWLTTAVLIAVIVSTQVTRDLFGYSFATWRFHLRGETIRSAADIGRIRDLTVQRLMRQDVRTVPAEMTVEEFLHSFPPGSTGQVAAVETDGRYAGMVIVAEANAVTFSNGGTVRELLRFKDDVLYPGMNVQEAVASFDRTEAEALAVIDSPASRKIVGLLSEAYALRRYSAELEQHRRELVGNI